MPPITMEPRWLTIARQDLGVVEVKGKLSNPRIVEMFKEAGFSGIKDDSVAWCAAALGSWLKRAGLKPSASLAARSYETWGERLERPMLGAIGVKRRAGGAAWQGHVGIVVAANPTTIWMVSGNSADSVNIAPFSRWQFTAVRWPAGEPWTDAPLPTSAPGKAGSEA